MSAAAHLSQFLFNLGLISGLLLTWVWARVGLLFTFFCPGCRKCVNSTTLTLLSVMWSLPFWLSCYFIKVRFEGISEFREAMAAKKGKPRVILQNHVSFLDAILATQIMDCRTVGDMKSMAADMVFKLPILGAVAVACGHLRVPFKTQETKAQEPADGIQRKGSIADFSVDKDEIAKVKAQFEQHVQDGGIGAWYPEGRLNPDPDSGLQQFRAGGFSLVVDVDCEIWCCATKNANKCWDRKAKLGGHPATLYGKCFKLCDSSHAFLQKVPGDGRAKAMHMANHAHDKMSEVVKSLGEGLLAQAA